MIKRCLYPATFNVIELDLVDCSLVSCRCLCKVKDSVQNQ